MPDRHIVIDRRHQCGEVRINGTSFRCTFRTDWGCRRFGVHPRDLVVEGIGLPHLKFGFAAPWDWILDLDATEMERCLLVRSQGYRTLDNGRVPYMWSRRYLFDDPDMLYEVVDACHLERKEYVIAGPAYGSMDVDPMLARVAFRGDGVSLWWQFRPRPVTALFEDAGRTWTFGFDTAHVEVLVTWSTDPHTVPPEFDCLSGEIGALAVRSDDGAVRVLDQEARHQCLEPGDRLVLPPGEIVATGLAERDGDLARFRPGLWDLAVRRCTPNRVSLGAARFLAMDRLPESGQFPVFKPYLVRGLRSLLERRIFNVVTEDDPAQSYLWGVHTWPRCLSVLALDAFDFTEQAYGYLEFLMDASRRFRPLDGLDHLWDIFTILGHPCGEDRAIDGHAIKLFEAGKFYLRHRGDPFGTKLLAEGYDTLRDWCDWILLHMDSSGRVLDVTEANAWNQGFGVFTQSAAAAGLRLFLALADDAGRPEDRDRFARAVDRLMAGLREGLFGDAANPYFEIPEGIGACFTTYIPHGERPAVDGTRPRRIGLSAYSLAPGFFLQDPQVGLLPPDDRMAAETLDLVLERLGDPFDPRMVRWHMGPSHLGYGQGQLLMALVHAGRTDVFRDRLQALFDVSFREVGDPYLMQEVLARKGNVNRGNKAHLAYFPVLAARLSGFAGGQDGNGFLPDFRVLTTEEA